MGAGLRSLPYPSTIRAIHSTLHRALDQAMKYGLVRNNASALADLPPMRQGEMQVFSSEEAKTYLAAIAGNRLEALYVLALTTGMRQGELLALTWSAIDLEARTLEVRASLSYYTWAILLPGAKDGALAEKHPPHSTRDRRA
jgi:integrase